MGQVSITERKYYLTGALAGKTITLSANPTSAVKFHFKDGACSILASLNDHNGYALTLERNWKAYPEGHPALEESNGQREVSQNGSQQVSGGSQPQGGGSAPGQPSGDGSGAAGAASGEAGSGPQGDGPQAELNEKLARAVANLDPTNDEHWTQDGRPAMTAVERFYGSADITRKDVEAAAPGVTRSKLRQ